MAITAPRPPVEIRERLYTAADLAELPSELPSGPVLYELDNGRLVSLPVHTDEHGAVECNIAARLKLEGEARELGKARAGGIAIVLWRNPDRVVGADAVFIGQASLPIRRSPEGYLETIPDLVVEVRSKNDTEPYVGRKVADYLAAGVRVVWVADPARQTITEHRKDAEPRTYRMDEIVTIEDVIPGFQLPVRDAFEL